MRNSRFQLALLLGVSLLQADGFIVTPPARSRSKTSSVTADQHSTFTRQRDFVLRAGFGGGSSKKKEAKIKPKQQWDRYKGDLKKERPYRVAVKAEGKNSDEWLEVGNVKSKGGEYTKAAVARQRALIAEVSQKDKIEWAFWNADGGDWIIVDKEVLEEGSPEGLEKLIGFEGRPDPATGFYCMYNEGKLVNSDEDLKNRSSKKLQ